MRQIWKKLKRKSKNFLIRALHSKVRQYIIKVELIQVELTNQTQKSMKTILVLTKMVMQITMQLEAKINLRFRKFNLRLKMSNPNLTI